MFTSNKTYTHDDTEIILSVSNYATYNNLALVANTEDDDSPYASFSVNIKPLPANHFAADVNNHPDIETWLETNNIATNTNQKTSSGLVTYPIFKLTDEFLDSLDLPG